MTWKLGDIVRVAKPAKFALNNETDVVKWWLKGQLAAVAEYDTVLLDTQEKVDQLNHIPQGGA